MTATLTDKETRLEELATAKETLRQHKESMLEAQHLVRMATYVRDEAEATHTNSLGAYHMKLMQCVKAELVDREGKPL